MKDDQRAGGAHWRYSKTNQNSSTRQMEESRDYKEQLECVEEVKGLRNLHVQVSLRLYLANTNTHRNTCRETAIDSVCGCSAPHAHTTMGLSIDSGLYCFYILSHNSHRNLCAL